MAYDECDRQADTKDVNDQLGEKALAENSRFGAAESGTTIRFITR
jgi:hypothetical protein